MTINVGSADRVVRVIIGLVLIVLPYVTNLELWTSSIARFALPIVGLVLVVAALFRFCPLYRLIGVRTCKA